MRNLFYVTEDNQIFNTLEEAKAVREKGIKVAEKLETIIEEKTVKSLYRIQDGFLILNEDEEENA